MPSDNLPSSTHPQRTLLIEDVSGVVPEVVVPEVVVEEQPAVVPAVVEPSG